jgi:WD40 repeat protein
VALSAIDAAPSPPLPLRQERGLGGEGDLPLIQGALRLSAHVLARDKTQLAGQLLGRLLGRDEVAIRGLLDQARQWRRGEPWLRPLTSSLTLPGGPLLHILPGHAPSPVYAVAATPDGRQAISAAADGTLKVWDLDHGVEVATLRTDAQYALLTVTVTRDGRRAVAGSTGKTVEVWDLQTKTHLRTLRRHTKDVNGVAVTSDGRRAISASHDQTLKVWDLERGQELNTLRSHTERITDLTVTDDGRYALSASDDHTLRLWDMESGAAVDRYVVEAPLLVCATSADAVVAGDRNGRMHFLRLEGRNV